MRPRKCGADRVAKDPAGMRISAADAGKAAAVGDIERRQAKIAVGLEQEPATLVIDDVILAKHLDTMRREETTDCQCHGGYR